MDYLFQPYLNLTAGQRRLLCFLAYVGRRIDSSDIYLYAKAENIDKSAVKKTLNSLTSFLGGYFYYREEYSLHAHHVAPLMLYMLRHEPALTDHFATYYKRMQDPLARQLLKNLQICLAHEKTSLSAAAFTSMNAFELLVPLVAEPLFFPLMRVLPPRRMLEFVASVAVWQVENDVADPDNMLSQVAQLAYDRTDDLVKDNMRAIVALYDYYKQGRYDAEAAALPNLYAHLLAGAKALYDADIAAAFTHLTTAMRLKNQNALAQEKGYFNMPLNNFMLVMAYHLKTTDEHKKLGAMIKKDGFRTSAPSRSVLWLAQYLVQGYEPSQQTVAAELNGSALHRPKPLAQYLALIMARFFHVEVSWPKTLPPQPRLWILRQELAAQPPALIARLRHKQRWELLLEELTPKATAGGTEKGDVRVSYLFNAGYVEVREQSRLRSGGWGAGKRMSWDTFRKGTPFMDDTDRRVAALIPYSYYSYDVTVEKVLPLLVGSDRVYTGRYAPFQPVTIDEEKPYLIIERTKKAFTVKSNLGNAKQESTVVYRKESDTRYVVITMTDRQRSYYAKLLSIGIFPLEAEQQLREFLPKVSDVVEVHSDLVEGGTTLEQRKGVGQLCLQVLPSPGARNLFDVLCLARPLPAGPSLFVPGQGLNPCVAEEDGVRYQVTRDMRTERTNLQLLTTFMHDSDLLPDTIDEPFAERLPLSLSADGLLATMEFVAQHADNFYIEWPEGGQLRLKTTNTAAWNIALKSKNGWFELEGEIPIDDDTVLTTAQLLQLVAEAPASGFVRLGESEFLRISDRLRKQLQRIESLTVSDHGHLHISELHASLLGSALSGEIEVKHDKKIDQLQKKIKKSMAQQPATPRQLKAELRDYQADGFQWMSRMTGWGAGVCLADDMGLGKTVQTIAFLLSVADEGPALVAAPASVVPNWRREFERFAPSLHVEVLNLSADRHEAIEKAAAADVIVTTYGLLVTESEDLLKKHWNTVCLDEAHVIKNRETKTSASVMKLQASHRIILTGTPVQNHLGELWNLYQFINPGMLGSYEQFQKKYIVPIEQQDNKERSRQLKRLVQPFILRRTKQEVIEELPDKTEVNMPVELSTDEMAVYEVIRRRAKKLLEDEQGGAPSVNTLAEITRLRQAACAAQLAEKSWKGESSKITALMQLLDEIVGGGNQVLVFSQFTSFLTLVRETLDKQHVDYIYLDGAVPMKRREQLVQEFQKGLHPVFLISLKAGGLGLNLTGANYVVHLDPWWNPAIEQQATDRAYRIGQRQNVTVYHLIAQHTIEEKILRLHETKRNLADAMLSGTSESHKLTSKELLQMIGG